MGLFFALFIRKFIKGAYKMSTGKHIQLSQFLSDKIKVWFYCRTKALADQMIEDAAAEGFTVGPHLQKKSALERCYILLGSDHVLECPNISGFCSAMKFNERFDNGRLVVKIDYEKLLDGRNDFFIEPVKVGIDELLEKPTELEKYGITYGSAALLVCEKDAQKRSAFICRLEAAGFSCWIGSGSYFPGADWLYVNINALQYAYGLPGVWITEEFGQHAITIEEFETIYNIFRKYTGKNKMEF